MRGWGGCGGGGVRGGAQSLHTDVNVCSFFDMQGKANKRCDFSCLFTSNLMSAWEPYFYWQFFGLEFEQLWH